MDLRTVGLTLIWFGVVLLAAVLSHRFRQGAWGDAAFEDSAPLSGAISKILLALAMILAAVGTGMMIWEFIR